MSSDMPYKAAWLFRLCLPLLPVVYTQAHAEESEDVAILEEVTVTGQLQERSLQDTQTSAAVISGMELDRSNDFDLYDIVERTPGIVSRFGEKGFIVRGIDQNGASGGDGISGTAVNVSIDGAEVPSSLGTFYGPYSGWDLQQVEVLRGPQSTQKGRNALAGAVHITTTDPVFYRETKVRADYGSRNTRRLSFAQNEALSENWAVRVVGDRSETDGWVDNPLAMKTTTMHVNSPTDVSKYVTSPTKRSIWCCSTATPKTPSGKILY